MHESEQQMWETRSIIRDPYACPFMVIMIQALTLLLVNVAALSHTALTTIM